MVVSVLLVGFFLHSVHVDVECFFLFERKRVSRHVLYSIVHSDIITFIKQIVHGLHTYTNEESGPDRMRLD